MKTGTLLLGLCLSAALVSSGCASKQAKCSAGAMSHATDSYFPPPPAGLPFDPFRTNVYTVRELLQDKVTSVPENYYSTLDWKCYTRYTNFLDQKQHGHLDEITARFMRLHDLAIEEALDRYLHATNASGGPKKVVCVLGGHALERRADSTYLQVALLSRKLSRAGYTIATGGGPGVMEAGNLGAWFANRNESELYDAVQILAKVPRLSPDGSNRVEWLAQAREVMAQYPRDDKSPTNRNTESISVPTWFYGNEPLCPFATHIAKYFENSLREEHLLAISTHGFIFARGSFGTVQEIFQSACQISSGIHVTNIPMVLLETNYWNPGTNLATAANSIPVWPAVQRLGVRGHFTSLRLTGDIDEAFRFITGTDHPRP
jgi:predicted Rossmann-fold nucleotide-binding protein